MLQHKPFNRVITAHKAKIQTQTQTHTHRKSYNNSNARYEPISSGQFARFTEEEEEAEKRKKKLVNAAHQIERTRA